MINAISRHPDLPLSARSFSPLGAQSCRDEYVSRAHLRAKMARHRRRRSLLCHVWPVGDDDQRDRSRRAVFVVRCQVLDVLMPSNSAILSAFCLLGHTVEGVPNDVEIPMTAGKMQRVFASKADGQRPFCPLLNDNAARNLSFYPLLRLAEQQGKGTQSSRRSGKFQFSVRRRKTT